jgi:hypothetical protein
VTSRLNIYFLLKIIEMAVLFPLSVITSLPFGTKILKFGKKMLRVHIKMSAENERRVANVY